MQKKNCHYVTQINGQTIGHVRENILFTYSLEKKRREKNKSQIQWNTQLKLKFRIECNGRGVDSFDLQIDVNNWMKQKQKQKKRKEKKSIGIEANKSPSLIEEIQRHQQRWRKRMCHIPLSFK